jgi:hypothetical protein
LCCAKTCQNNVHSLMFCCNITFTYCSQEHQLPFHIKKNHSVKCIAELLLSNSSMATNTLQVFREYFACFNFLVNIWQKNVVTVLWKIVLFCTHLFSWKLWHMLIVTGLCRLLDTRLDNCFLFHHRIDMCNRFALKLWQFFFDQVWLSCII